MTLPTKQTIAKGAPARHWTTTPAFVLVLLVLVAASAFSTGVWFASANDSPRDDEDFAVFWRSWDLLEDDFYYELPDETDLVYGAIQGLYRQAGDTYTFFAPPARAEADRQQISGEFGGIGAYVSQDQDGQIVVAAPFEGFPAEQAGLQANDVIRAVDGESVDGLTLEQAVALLRGEVGTPVTLTIFRPATANEFDVAIVRARVQLPNVRAEMMGETGYVRLFSFNGLAVDTLEQSIETLLDQGARALILDMRDNPGGLLDQAAAVSDLFLDEGLIVTQRDRRGREKTYQADVGELAEEVPVVVLVNGGSASASEVVAGALRDHGRAVLIGQTTYGKGSVQHVYDMPDGSQVHVTAAVWFTPNESPIQGEGLAPDIAVEPDEAAADEDVFITAALAYLVEQGLIAPAAPLAESE